MKYFIGIFILIISYQFATPLYVFNSYNTTDYVYIINNHKNKEPTFLVRNSIDITIPVQAVERSYQFAPNRDGSNIRCLTTRSPAATDIGPYNSIYLIFENGKEMPYRLAVFHIGKIAKVNAFKKISDSRYNIDVSMYTYDDFYTQENVIIVIDITNILTENAKKDKEGLNFEGHVESFIFIRIQR